MCLEHLDIESRGVGGFMEQLPTEILDKNYLDNFRKPIQMKTNNETCIG